MVEKGEIKTQIEKLIIQKYWIKHKLDIINDEIRNLEVDLNGVYKNG
jgi:hypothetical protein